MVLAGFGSLFVQWLAVEAFPRTQLSGDLSGALPSFPPPLSPSLPFLLPLSQPCCAELGTRDPLADQLRPGKLFMVQGSKKKKTTKGQTGHTLGSEEACSCVLTSARSQYRWPLPSLRGGSDSSSPSPTHGSK